MAIAFDFASQKIGGSGTSITLSHTCSGSNRILFVFVGTYNGGSGADNVTGITYNSVAMTQIAKVASTGPQELYLYYLIAPATGANNIVVSCSPTTSEVDIQGLSYTGAKQSGVPDASQTGGASSSPKTISVTTVLDNSWLVGGFESVQGAAIAASTGTTLRTPGGSLAGGMDSNGAKTPAGNSYSLVATSSAGNIGGIIASFAPALIAWDAASNSGYKASLSTYSWNHTVSAVIPNPGLLVNVSIFVAGTVTGITAGGTAMQFVRADTIGVYRNEIWQLPAVGTGTISIAVTLNTSLTSIASADSYTGVNQSDMVQLHAGTTGSGVSTPSASITPVDSNSWVLSGLTTSDATMSVGGSATQRNNQTGALGTGAISDQGPIIPSASTTMSWSAVTLTDSWALGVVVLDPLAGTLYASTFTASLSFSGTIKKTTNRNFTASLSFVGNMTKLTSRTYNASLSFVGAFSKLTKRSFVASLSFIGTVSKRASKSFTASLSFVGSISKMAYKNFTAALSFIGSIGKRTSKTFTASLSFIGNITTTFATFFNRVLNFIFGVPAPLEINLIIPEPISLDLVVPSTIDITLIVPAPIELTVF